VLSLFVIKVSSAKSYVSWGCIGSHGFEDSLWPDFKITSSGFQSSRMNEIINEYVALSSSGQNGVITSYMIFGECAKANSLGCTNFSKISLDGVTTLTDLYLKSSVHKYDTIRHEFMHAIGLLDPSSESIQCLGRKYTPRGGHKVSDGILNYKKTKKYGVSPLECGFNGVDLDSYWEGWRRVNFARIQEHQLDAWKSVAVASDFTNNAMACYKDDFLVGFRFDNRYYGNFNCDQTTTMRFMGRIDVIKSTGWGENTGFSFHSEQDGVEREIFKSKFSWVCDGCAVHSFNKPWIVLFLDVMNNVRSLSYLI